MRTKPFRRTRTGYHKIRLTLPEERLIPHLLKSYPRHSLSDLLGKLLVREAGRLGILARLNRH